MYDNNDLSFLSDNAQDKMFNQFPKLPYLQGFDLTVGLSSKGKLKDT